MAARVNRLVDALLNQDLKVKVEMIDEGAAIEGLQKVGNRITLGLLLAAIIVGAAMLMRVDTPFRMLEPRHHTSFTNRPRFDHAGARPEGIGRDRRHDPGNVV